jgi:hypothetical protein
MTHILTDLIAPGVAQLRLLPATADAYGKGKGKARRESQNDALHVRLPFFRGGREIPLELNEPASWKMMRRIA